MENKDYLNQLNDIQHLMNRSTRFLSLSGLSGILAGLYATIGSFIIYLNRNTFELPLKVFSPSFNFILSIAISILVLSLFTGIVLSKQKAKKTGEKIWNPIAKQFLINFSIPLLTGGALAIIMIERSYFDLVSPITLLFYGLALINASRYTLETLRSLGILFLILGLLNAMYPGYGLYFWTLGFGFAHIGYGSYMYFKYDRK